MPFTPFNISVRPQCLIQAKGVCARIKRAVVYQSRGDASGEQPRQGK